jgi:glycosyltransferase involved in cell wall biosynthesis
MPLFSVVIPLYNKEQDIPRTLHSVLQQDFSDFEIILVDDGSQDGSLRAAQKVRDERIKIYSKQNEGVGPTRNYGVEKATGRYIAFLDADDLWLDHHLSDLEQLIKEYPDADWFCTAYQKRFNDRLVVPLESPIMFKHPWSGRVDDYFGASLVESIGWTSAVCMAKQFFQQLGGFDTSITHGAGEDTDLWIRAALESAPVFTTRISSIYNLQGTNRISFTPTLNRTFMDPDKYENKATGNPNLKKYLDLNRFSFGLQHKMAGDSEGYRKFTGNLDKSNLNTKQRMLLNLPVFALKIASGIQLLVSRAGIRLSSFK